MLTEKDYCDYETCVALKELGYKIPTSAYYMPNNKQLFFVSNPYRGGYVIDCFYSHNSFPEDIVTHDYIDAPTMWEAQKWLREEKGIIVYPMSIGDLQHQKWYAKIEYMDFYCYPICDTYEDALAEGLCEAIKILKEKLNEET